MRLVTIIRQVLLSVVYNSTPCWILIGTIAIEIASFDEWSIAQLVEAEKFCSLVSLFNG